MSSVDALIISQADSRPMYAQIMEQIKQRVAVGDWAPGFEIPSIRQLAVALRVSVITVKRAYLELEREGVILTQHGKGSVIAQDSGLGSSLLNRELDNHLTQAVRLANQLALSPAQLETRLRNAAAGTQEETQ